MFESLDELALAIGQANARNDLETLTELEQCFEVTDQPGPLPLTPEIVVVPDRVNVAAPALESDRVLGLANALSRAKRRIVYFRSKWSGVNRPVIVSEGDSWFQFPARLQDVIDVLLDDYQLLSLGAAGDLLTDMVSREEYVESIESENADIFLISGGGNDMLHSGRLRQYLHPYAAGMDEGQLLNRDRWETFLQQLWSAYDGLFRSLTGRFPNLRILCHGYDYALPQSGGKWLGQPLADRGVPESMWDRVVGILIDEFNETLIQLCKTWPGRVVHVDCRGAVGATATSWFDELHPKDAGYARVAKKFAEAIDNLTAAGEGSAENLAASPRPAAGPGTKPPEKLKYPLPEAVARQFVSRATNIAQPSPGMVTSENLSSILEEAIIEAGRADVGPRLPRAPETAAPVAGEDTSPDPDDFGHVRTSAVVRDVVDSVLQDKPLPPAPPLSIAGQDRLSDQALLKMSPCSSVEAWQAHLRKDPDSIDSYNAYAEVREKYEEEESDARLETRLELLPETDLFFQERIIGRSNLEQINFLSRGERAARTVGRLSIFSEYDIPAGTGTGFLVGPGLLLTNHHVLSSIRGAGLGSYVLFDYEYDADNRLKTSERFQLAGDLFYTDRDLDFTFVSVAPVGSRGSQIEAFGRLQLIAESGKALKGEPVSILQHPGGLPKQIAIRDSTVVGRKGAFIYYHADTNRGSSGSPVVNDQWFPVALHHRSVPHYFRPCEYVANRGIRISVICRHMEQAANAGDEMAARIIERLQQRLPGTTSLPVAADPGSVSPVATEKFVEPFHELPYDNREGYDDDFLGHRVRMPWVKNAPAIAAPRIDTESPKYLLTYEHFSIVMHRQRRLAAFTAANVDASAARKRPEPGKKYGRKALGGLGKNDREKWFEDPRISSAHQLPDRFFEKDRKSFDKGHLTMRAEVAWGDSYDELRRANGDTFHTTNCSPQIADFNRAVFGFDGLWGQLEELVLEQAENEKLCVFAGPILDAGDSAFRGKDHTGEVFVQIPAAYWKVIVAEVTGGIETFAFILEQDLSDVEFDPDEFEAPGEWVSRRTTVAEIEERTEILKFPPELHSSDGG